MSIELIMSCWDAAEKRGAMAKPVYAVFSSAGLVDWSVDRKEAARIAEQTEASRLAKIVPI